MAILKINERDNVAVALDTITEGETFSVDSLSIKALEKIDKGHKIALRDIKQGENVIKYGFPIGHATTDIKAGQWVHTHNVKTNLGEISSYEYNPHLSDAEKVETDISFKGFL
ncbi:MAG: UxaA family hydrolase, partial [Tepidanaerobacteraceae bacterium]